MENTIELSGIDETRLLFGAGDRNLRLVRDACGVEIVARNGFLKVRGEPEAVERACWVFGEMLSQLRAGKIPAPGELERLLGRRDPSGATRDKNGATGDRNGAAAGEPAAPPRPGFAPVDVGVTVRPRTAGQERYVQAIKKYDVVFGIGPAGTGKTYLAVAMAVSALRTGRVRRIVLTRPAVEAGERLGFLPGDFLAKVNPFVRPLYDALADILSWAQIQKYIDKDVIEVVPLAYMRGRTLEGAFLILDEAQNTTSRQMKMFLTRLGVASKAVITGDVTQIDLDQGTESGLIAAERILTGLSTIAFCYMDRNDIVRHHLVQDIVDAYEKSERRQTDLHGATSP
ncbi:MAG: PhoH family protein [Planctomycetes bacterium]|nr:PhoH family protein [Planctomycetota bacterium]